MQEAAEYAPGTMIAVLGLDDESGRGGLPACRRRGLDRELQRTRAGDRRRHLRGCPRGRRRSPRSSAPNGCWPCPSAAPSTPPSCQAPGTGSGRPSRRRPSTHSTPVVVANVDARLHDDPEEWPQLLSAQLCSPVRWRQSLDTLLGEGMQTFVELGPGGVLTGLAAPRGARPQTRSASRSPPPTTSTVWCEILAGGMVGGAAPAGEHFHMTERLVVSPVAGLFEPAPGLGGYLPGGTGRSAEPVVVEVGGLLGLVGTTEVRSAFSGTLEGVLGARWRAGDRVASRSPGCGPSDVHDERTA